MTLASHCRFIHWLQFDPFCRWLLRSCSRHLCRVRNCQSTLVTSNLLRISLGGASRRISGARVGGLWSTLRVPTLPTTDPAAADFALGKSLSGCHLSAGSPPATGHVSCFRMPNTAKQEETLLETFVDMRNHTPTHTHTHKNLQQHCSCAMGLKTGVVH